MSLSRRLFFRNLGLGSAGLLSTRSSSAAVTRPWPSRQVSCSLPMMAASFRISSNENARALARRQLTRFGTRSRRGSDEDIPGLYRRSRRNDCRPLRGRPRPRHCRHRVRSHSRGGDAGVLLGPEAAGHRGADLWNRGPDGAPHRRPGQDDCRRSIAGLDTDAMAEAAKGAGMIFFCNPNNPTGTVHNAAAMERFVRRVSRARRRRGS